MIRSEIRCIICSGNSAGIRKQICKQCSSIEKGQYNDTAWLLVCYYCKEKISEADYELFVKKIIDMHDSEHHSPIDLI